ncbi:MAG: PEP-CTERM system histidine kinase PrsK, partial [Gammaproteobacteria bacterium]|nr:PEP-CTERM system histidine kinase PrsK [Gammaproteobacteria bacterium]
MPEQVRQAVRWVWLLVILACMVTLLPVVEIERVFPDADVYLVALLLLDLLALAMAAQFFGEATIDQESALKLICLAAVLVVGPQALMATVSLLSQQVPPWMMLLRIVAMIVALGLVVKAWRNNLQWSLAVFISPRARAYASKLSAVFAQLLLILVLTPLFRSFDSKLAVYAGSVFAIGSYGLLFLLLFSERLRAQLRVFVSKHFLPFRYDYREEWLRLIDTLAAPVAGVSLPERAIQGVAQIVASPAGVLWMRRSDDEPFHCVAGWNTEGWNDVVIDVADPALKFMTERNWILDTAELNRRPDLYPGIVRPAWLEQFPDALLIVPLISNNSLLGFVVLFQSSSSFRLSYEEIDLLRTSGRQVAAYLAQYVADRQLSEAKQFEAFNRLTAFVMHDLKNLIAQQSLMVRNAEKHKANPAFFEDAMATIDNSVGRMNKLLAQLQTGKADRPRRSVKIADVLRDAVDRCKGRLPAADFDDKNYSGEILTDREALASVLAHMIRNAQEATPDEGYVRLSVDTIAGQVQVLIEDNGSGMDVEFIRERLFKPFDSTKGSQGMGIGAYQARSFVLAAGGSFEVESATDVGTRITIRLPIKDVGT